MCHLDVTLCLHKGLNLPHDSGCIEALAHRASGALGLHPGALQARLLAREKLAVCPGRGEAGLPFPSGNLGAWGGSCKAWTPCDGDSVTMTASSTGGTP